MKLYMHWGDAWDLMFRSFLVFIFFGLLWLKYIDATIPCMFGFPIPLILAVAYFYWGWRKAKLAWLKEQSARAGNGEEPFGMVAHGNEKVVSQTTTREV